MQVTLHAGALLPHRFSLACGRLPDPSAVCSLLHYPLGRPNLALASILPCEVPTFLDPVVAEPRPPVQLPVSIESTTVDRRLRPDRIVEELPSTKVAIFILLLDNLFGVVGSYSQQIVSSILL